jgi:hypothetical protein
MLVENIFPPPWGKESEFRCYNEAAESEQAAELNASCMEILTALRKNIH